MANEAVGDIDCAWCGTVSEIRKNSKQKYYVYCPCCGINQPALAGFQDRVINRGRFHGAEAGLVRSLAAYKPEPLKPEPAAEPEPAALKPEPEPAALKPDLKPETKPAAPPRRGLTKLAAGVADFMRAEE